MLTRAGVVHAKRARFAVPRRRLQLPIGARRTYGTCTYCGLVTELDTETRDRLVTQTSMPGQSAAPGGGLPGPEQPSQPYR